MLTGACLHPTGHVHLTLDLLTSPPRGVEGTRAILAGVSRVPDQGSNPLLAEEGSKLAVRESIDQVTTHLVSKRRTVDKKELLNIPKNTHGRSHKSLAPAARVLRNDVKKLEDRLDKGLKLDDLRGTLVRQENTTPGIHDTFTKRDDVVERFKSNVGTGGNGRSLLKDLSNDWQVNVELCPDGLSNITECFEDGRLQLVGRAL